MKEQTKIQMEILKEAGMNWAVIGTFCFEETIIGAFYIHNDALNFIDTIVDSTARIVEL